MNSTTEAPSASPARFRVPSLILLIGRDEGYDANDEQHHADKSDNPA